MKVFFIGNSVKVKGVVVYILLFSVCFWNEEYLFYSVEKVFCWNNIFVYSGNFFYLLKNFKFLLGLDYDIVIDIYYFKDEDNDDKSIKVSFFL